MVLGVGIIGCGRIFDLHALSYTRTDKAKIVAVCDSSEGKARGKAEDLGISRVYTDYRELLKDDSVDLVEILVPHYLHAEITIAAAEAGKHVSVQKPPAMNLREMDEMIAATRKSGVKFRVFENFIFYPPYRKAKEIMDSGEIGKVQSIRIKTTSGGGGCGWNVPWDALAWRLSRDLCGGGPNVWDDGYHKFSLGIFLGGDIDWFMLGFNPRRLHPI